MKNTTAPQFRMRVIALAASTLFFSQTSWALTLSTSPPGTIEPYVRPNIILSLDDSTSMNVNMYDASNTLLGTRTQVLIKAVKDTFSDTTLLPDEKIRLAWQSMNNCVSVGGVKAGTLLTAGDATSATKPNVMRIFDSTHRAYFLSYMDKYNACGYTPTHDVAKAADDYMRAATHKNGPWSSNPGGTNAASTEYLGCRRNYHILLTDGGWNGTERQTTPRNYDGTPANWPTNVPSAAAAQTALYRDAEDYTTISDWAFKSWAHPLKTAAELTGTLEPSKEYRTAPATETFKNRLTGVTATLDRYWNPRYDPAEWAHMSTFTIGFSGDALPNRNYNPAGNDKGAIVAPTTVAPYGFDGSFAEYVKGDFVWRAQGKDRGHDMWHAALNGRGQFYAVEKGEDLKEAFRKIIGTINIATEPDVISSATSGSNVSRNSVGKYTASYEPEKAWKGSVTADIVQADGTTVPDANWAGKSTADRLDAHTNTYVKSNRLVISWSDQWNATAEKGGVAFKWASDESYLSTSQKTLLKTNISRTVETDAKGEERLNYIRGDRSLEGSSAAGYTAAKPYRERKSRQGDIINSDVWYTGAPSGSSLSKGYAAFVKSNASRPKMIYVGGNDGMLHGFTTALGEEVISYVPRGVIASLPRLTDPTYNNTHRYFVDGSPMTGDIDLNGGMKDNSDQAVYDAYVPNWRTLLVGSLGLGGKGYFVLDVTNPTINTLPSGPAFKEANASQLVLMDRTRGSTEVAMNCATKTGAEKTACLKTVEEDKDIGHITAKPVRDENDPLQSAQIVKMNNNRYAVVLGNGYNSTNQRPVLLIQYLDGTTKELLRIPATSDAAGSGYAKDNGLSAPRLIDLNGDETVDVVYAGDNLGNMWKFDLNSHLESEWKVAFGGSPLFTAEGPDALNSTSRTKVQPITAPPTVQANDRSRKVVTGPTSKMVKVGGMMVAFGTGRNVTDDDTKSVQVQTLYSILDNTRYREVTTPKGIRLEVHPGGGSCPNGSDCVPSPAALGVGVTNAKLAQQQITSVNVAGTIYGKVDTVTDLNSTTWNTYNGWYLDLPEVGERLLKNMEFYDNSNLLTVYTQVPAKGSNATATSVETCDAASVDGERQYMTLINIMDGKRPYVQILDANSDNLYTAAGDLSVSRLQVSNGPHNIVKKDKFENVDIDSKNKKIEMAAMPEQSLRPSWRQIK